MDFDLPREVRLVRRSVREFAGQHGRAARRADGAARRVPHVARAGAWRTGRARPGDARRARRLEPRPPRAHGRGRGDQPRLGRRRHQPAGPPHGRRRARRLRQRRAEGEVPPALCRGDSLGTCAITEPTGGSDLLGMASTARPVSDGYVLNGRKCFITNCHLSDAVVTVAKTGEGPKGISAFIVEKGTPGFAAGRHEHKLGLRGADTGELVFRDCHVPRENLLGNEGDGMTIALKTIGEVGRPGMAATSLGILQACYDESVRVRQGAHALRPSDRATAGDPVGHCRDLRRVAGLALACYHAAWLKDSGRDCGVETTLAKMYVSEAAVDAAKKAIEIHGACGTMMDMRSSGSSATRWSASRRAGPRKSGSWWSRGRRWRNNSGGSEARMEHRRLHEAGAGPPPVGQAQARPADDAAQARRGAGGHQPARQECD